MRRGPARSASPATEESSTTYKLIYLGADLAPRSSTDLNGLPSRARMSSDGTLASTTMFVSGHSYAGNNFSTETVIHDLANDKDLGSIEKWKISINGKVSTAPGLNVWGVTFLPGPKADVFYATVGLNGRTWLARGSVSGQEASNRSRRCRVPFTLPRRDACCVQEAQHGQRRAHLAPDRARPGNRQGDTARRDPFGRRSSRMAGQRTGPVRHAARGQRCV